MTTLQARAADGLTLGQAIQRAGFTAATAMLSTPTRHWLAAMVGGVVTDRSGTADLGSVYEARIFDGDRELRWLNESAGQGRAALLAEDGAALPAGFGAPLPAVPTLAVLDQRYLLWGQVEGSSERGWTTLYSPRIGPLDVPHPAEPGARLRLVVREYIAAEERHGNAYVADERLIRLESYHPLQRKGAR
jgi:CRISPR-associated protein (TIGR03984 family)